MTDAGLIETGGRIEEALDDRSATWRFRDALAAELRGAGERGMRGIHGAAAGGRS